MIRNIKALGLALVAVFAMSAMAASAAQAEGEGAPDFWAAQYPAHIEATPDPGSGRQVLTSPFGKVRCEEVQGTAVLNERSNELTSEEIGYSGDCTALGLFPTTVDAEGCHFTFTVEETETASTSNGSVHLDCPEGTGSITVTIFEVGSEPPHPEEELICTIHIPGGQTFGGITYHNIETEDGIMHVTVEANTGGVIHESHEGSLCGTGTSETDSYTGSFIASATNSKGEPINTTITDT